MSDIVERLRGLYPIAPIELEAAIEIVRLRHKLGPFADEDPFCAVCGRSEPCTEAPDACTFDPTPRELYEACNRLRARIAELERERDEARDRALEEAAALCSNVDDQDKKYAAAYGLGYGATPLQLAGAIRALKSPAQKEGGDAS